MPERREWCVVTGHCITLPRDNHLHLSRKIKRIQNNLLPRFRGLAATFCCHDGLTELSRQVPVSAVRRFPSPSSSTRRIGRRCPSRLETRPCVQPDPLDRILLSDGLTCPIHGQTPRSERACERAEAQKN